MRERAREVIFDAGGGVRLQGFHSPQDARSRGLVILLHGWEGSAESTYILHAGRFLFDLGYEVFRLNFRDHGQTHHLNEGLFYGTLFDEVFSAVRQAAALDGSGRVFLAGFSLGGNFALRVARRCAREPITDLRHILAVSPALDPAHATDAIDASPILRWYFLKKWRRSLMVKQALYPGLYDFSGLPGIGTLRGLTEELIRRSGIYLDAETYFRGYTLSGAFLEDSGVPVTIVAARDDPAIPVEDFQGLDLASHGTLVIHTYGGHNGFLYGPWAPAWYERIMPDLF